VRPIIAADANAISFSFISFSSHLLGCTENALRH
jgi:hypothetical protein